MTFQHPREHPRSKKVPENWLETPAARGQRSNTIDVDEATFSEIPKLNSASRECALQSANTVLIDLYVKVEEHISRKIAVTEWSVKGGAPIFSSSDWRAFAQIMSAVCHEYDARAQLNI